MRKYIIISLFFLFFAFIYFMSKPDLGGSRRLFGHSGFDMSEFHCEPIPYYIYTPFPFSITKTDSCRFKFKISEDEFRRFNEKYKNILDWYGRYEGEPSPGDREYANGGPEVSDSYIRSMYEYSSSRIIWIYYAPSLGEIKFVVFDH